MTDSTGESATSCVIAYPEEIDLLKPFSTMQTGKGVGSAFFVRCATKDPNLWVALTCYHVIANARDVRLLVPKLGSRQISATVLSVLPDYDLALLTVVLPHDAREIGLRSLEVGDSDALRAGALVTTYGFPLASKNMKVSEGVYAGISDDGLLQTTAAISPGNSGGVMVHDGKAIGVVSAKIINVEAANVGFAIPIALYRMYASTMISNPIVLRPMFGFCVQRLPDALLLCEDNEMVGSATLCGPGRGGVLVVRVYDNCPLIGLKVGDVITSFSWNGETFEVDSYGETRVRWSATKIDCMDALERVPLETEVSFHLARHAEVRGIRSSSVRTGLLRRFVIPQQPWVYCCALGMCFVPLCANLTNTRDANVAAAIFRIADEDRHKDRVMTSWVLPNSMANEYTIGAGMIVSRVNDVSVCTIPELVDALTRPRHGSTIIVEFTNSRVYAVRTDVALRTETQLLENKVYIPSAPFMRSLEKKLVR